MPHENDIELISQLAGPVWGRVTSPICRGFITRRRLVTSLKRRVYLLHPNMKTQSDAPNELCSAVSARVQILTSLWAGARSLLRLPTEDLIWPTIAKPLKSHTL